MVHDTFQYFKGYILSFYVILCFAFSPEATSVESCSHVTYYAVSLNHVSKHLVHSASHCGQFDILRVNGFMRYSGFRNGTDSTSGMLCVISVLICTNANLFASGKLEGAIVLQHQINKRCCCAKQPLYRCFAPPPISAEFLVPLLPSFLIRV